MSSELVEATVYNHCRHIRLQTLQTHLSTDPADISVYRCCRLHCDTESLTLYLRMFGCRTGVTVDLLLIHALQQMRHVEFAKAKLADTIRGWYANTKARQAEYAQQLHDTEAAQPATPREEAAYSALPQPDVQAPPPVVTCTIDILCHAVHCM